MRKFCVQQHDDNVIGFNLGDHHLRIVKHDGDFWLVVNDFIDYLELTNVADALHDLDDDERASETLNSPGGPEKVSLVSENGFRKLIARSPNPESECLNRWASLDVLPMVRRTAHCGMNVGELLDDPVMLRWIISINEERIEDLEAQITRDKPKVEFYDSIVDTEDMFEQQQA